MDVTIVCSTFGNYKWQLLAQQRALPNAHSFGVPVIYNHCESLHEARNLGLSQVETEFVCFLDADDELEPWYFEEMELVDGDLRPPSVRYIGNAAAMPRIPEHDHVCVADCLAEGNWLVVGTVARTKLLRDVGGWRDYPVFEDFDLWQRCWLAGATITPVPGAVYMAYSDSNGRNKSIPYAETQLIRQQICATNLGVS